MTRTPFLKPDEMSVEQRRIYDDIVASRCTWLNGPYAPLLLQPQIAEPAQQLGNFVRYHTSLGAQFSELAILVTARHWDCDFEWVQHGPIALKSGVAPEVVEAILEDRLPGNLDAKSKAIYDFASELLKQHKVSDGTYASVIEHFGVVGAVELSSVVGYYTMIAFTLIAHEVPLPKGAIPPFSGLGAQRMLPTGADQILT